MNRLALLSAVFAALGIGAFYLYGNGTQYRGEEEFFVVSPAVVFFLGQALVFAVIGLIVAAVRLRRERQR